MSSDECQRRRVFPSTPVTLASSLLDLVSFRILKSGFFTGEILPLQGHEIAKLPINTQIQAFGNIARPEDGAKWQLRFQIQFLFPK